MKSVSTWQSERVGQPITLARWGFHGRPVLLFPTAGGDAEECERMGLVEALRPLIEGGGVKLYSCDSISGRVWTDGQSTGAHRAWVQNRFDEAVLHEVVPAIRADCASPDIEVVTAGASVGAFNALAALCRHPEVFDVAVCMSGTYDVSRWMGGEHTLDLHYCSPLHFLPDLPEGPSLDRLRQRFVILATGKGRWEDPGESWKVAHTLGTRGIPNRVDVWGPTYDHDWPTWREMLPNYLRGLAR